MNTLQTVLNTPPRKLTTDSILYTHKYSQLRLMTAILLLLVIFLMAASMGVWLSEFTIDHPNYFLKELRGVC